MVKTSRRNKIRLTNAEKIYQIIIWIAVGIVTLSCILPFMYVIGMSFTSQGEMIQRNYFVIIPHKPMMKAYTDIIGMKFFWGSLGVSVARTVLGVIAGLILTIPAGYILAQNKMRGRNLFMLYFIITMILNGGLIPTYLLFAKLKLINKFWVYVVPAFSGVFNMLIVKLFVTGIPGPIIESADIDGASELQKLWHIAIPLLIPTICALSLFIAVGQWNAWFDAMLFVRNPEIQPVQYLIRNLMLSGGITDTADGSLTLNEKVSTESIKMASVIIAVLPILMVYPFLQKYFIFGVYTGAVKG